MWKKELRLAVLTTWVKIERSMSSGHSFSIRYYSSNNYK